MAMNMDAMLRIRADVQGENKIVALNRGLRSVETTAVGVTGAMRGMTGAAAGLSGALGTLVPLLSVAGLAGMVKGAIEAGDRINDLAQSTGITVEALSRFSKAASVSGTDIEGVSKGLVKLSKVMLDAATNGKQSAAAFAALGINIKNSDGSLKSADRVMLEVANRFKAMPDGVAKTALALKLFGKSGADLVPLLNMGGDAIDKMSTKMTTAFAQKADQYSDKLAILGGKVGALGADLTIALLPTLDKITDVLTSAIDGFSKLPGPIQQTAIASAAFALAFGPIKSLVSGTIGVFAALANGLEILRYQTALAGGVMPLLMGGIRALSAAILAIPGWGWALAGVVALGALSKALYDNNEDFRNWVNNVGTIVAGDFNNAMKNMQNLGASAVRGVSNEWQRLVNATKQAANAIGNAFSGPFGFIANAAGQVFGSVQRAIAQLWNNIPAPIRKALGQTAMQAALGPIGAYTTNVAIRAFEMGSQQTVNRAAKGDRQSNAPGYQADLSALNQGVSSGRGSGVDDAKQALENYNNALRSASDLLRDVKRKVEDVTLETKGLGKTGLDAIEQNYVQGYTRAKREIENLEQKLKDLRQQRDKASLKGIDTSELTKQIQKTADEIMNLRKAQDALGVAQAVDAAKKMLPSLDDYINRIGEAAQIEANRKHGIEGLTEVQKVQIAVERNHLRDLIAVNPELKKYVDALLEQAAAVDKLNKVQKETFNANFKQKLQDAYKSATDLGSAFGTVAVDAINGLSNKIVEFAETGKAAFADLAREILRSLAQIAIKAAIFQFAKAVVPGLFAADGMVATNGIRPFAAGGIVTSPTMFAFANGGVPGVGLMGEAGPEAIIPLKRGADGKLGVAGGGGTSVVVNVDASGSSVQGDSGRGEQLGRAISQAVQAELIKQRRPGGLLAA